ncbi:MAG: glycosyltransferase [Lentisphaerae bacterium]|nr:glycosyltransferase [Lentisphaerota bacterium]
MPPRIDQIQAGFAEGDAISHEAVILRDIFRGWSLESDIFAESGHISRSEQAHCRPLGDYRAESSDVAIYHYSIVSPATAMFLASPARKIVLYHNITPADYFSGFDDGLAARLEEARRNLADVVRAGDAVWADSRYNATEVEALGLKPVNVFPLLFSPKPLDVPPDPQVVKHLKSPLTNLLFVGRIAPNKRVEDLITAFAWYQKRLNPFSRLLIVGSEWSCPRYYLMLRMLAGELDLANVCFDGFASPGGLPAYYEIADAFVTASAHEGYCLPLLEAMHKKVPVIANNVGGVPEAMEDAGVRAESLSPIEMAVLIHRVISDASLRRAILDSQSKRMQRLQQRPVESELKALLAGFLPGLL